ISSLRGRSEYDISLCYIDSQGRLFVPRNAFHFVTENAPPSIPQNLHCEKNIKGEYILSWDPSSDDDGSVMKYDIFTEKDDHPFLIGSTGSPQFVLPPSIHNERIILSVRSVDDKGAMSALSSSVWSRTETFCLFGIKGSYYYPVYSLRDTFTRGYGASFFVGRNNVFVNGLCAGLDIGGIRLTGTNANKGDLFSALFDCSYMRTFRDIVSFSISVAGGSSYYGGSISGDSFQRFIPTGNVTAGAGFVIGRGSLNLSVGSLFIRDQGKTKMAPHVSFGASISIGR
ncbi:MAG TPA: hypothetical protein VF857_00330, partial [Spirochaetota bacterium]